jgi:glycosyltransferase involved in cell wall biosynthesis
MKPVLHVITTICRGGAENQLMVLIREQRKVGRAVSVLFLKGEPELAQELETLGVDVIYAISAMKPLAQIGWTRRFLQGRNLVIHAHLPRAQLLVAASIQTQPFVISRHDAEPFFSKAPAFLSKALSRYVAKKAQVAIAISNSVELVMQVRREFPLDLPIEVVHYGFDARFTEHNKVSGQKIREDVGISSESLVIGTVARIVEQKDFPTLLTAFSLYCQQFDDSYLVIAGDGPLKDDMQSLAQGLGISSRVKWLGRRSDIIEILSAFDIFVLASKTEGFGLVLLEAMVAGIAIIGSNTTAIPEVLGGGSGLLFETGNPQELSSALQALRSVEVRKEFIKNGNVQLASFLPETMREKIDRIYETAESLR